MNLFRRIIAWFRPPRPDSSEDLAAAQDAARIHDEMASTRLSNLAGGDAYQTGRKPHR